MHTANCLPLGKIGLSKALWSVLIFCALTIGSSAQVSTTLASFEGSNGGDPNAGLVQGNDGNFFGTTYYGGIGIGDTCNGCGTIFKMTPQGALTLLYSFCSQPGCADGALPDVTLVQGVDGNFYGEASEGGISTPPATGQAVD